MRFSFVSFVRIFVCVIRVGYGVCRRVFIVFYRGFVFGSFLFWRVFGIDRMFEYIINS